MQPVILVVDDDEDVRRTIVHSLDVLSYESVEAMDGKTALDVFRERRPHLVILDYLMPDMNGVELADAMRHLKPEVPVIFASGYAEKSDLIRQMERGVPVLNKPFRIDELADLIEQAL